MKTKVLMSILLFLGMFMVSKVYALGGCAGCGLWYTGAACPPGPCAKYMTQCQCTDGGWYYNGCISHCKYCMAFGNVGGR